MEPATVGAVLEAVARHWTVPDGIEITLEANPSSVEADRFRGYRAAGVNRVSLGVQALNDKDLRFLGRLHDVEEALRAIGLARDIFPRLSFDLIYARPGQTLEAWEAELDRAIALAADHLSLYQLTIEEGTRFHALSCQRRLRDARCRPCRGPLCADACGHRRARPAGLRDLQPRSARAPRAGTTSPTGAMANMSGSGQARMGASSRAASGSSPSPKSCPRPG